MRLPIRSLPVLSLAAFLALAPLAAQAAMDNGEPSTPTCPRGQVYDTDTAQCVDQQSGVVTDDALTTYAFALANAGRFEEALEVIDLRVGEHDVRSLTARGYTIRKSGEVEASLCYYMDAITMDGSDTRPRQYLGEAYVQLGELDLAREQLEAIAEHVGTGHAHYVVLAQMIAAAS